MHFLRIYSKSHSLIDHSMIMKNLKRLFPVSNSSKIGKILKQLISKNYVLLLILEKWNNFKMSSILEIEVINFTLLSRDLFLLKSQTLKFKTGNIIGAIMKIWFNGKTKFWSQDLMKQLNLVLKNLDSQQKML